MTGRVKIAHLPAKMRPVWPSKKTIDIERRLVFGARGIAMSKPSTPPRPRPGLALFLIPIVSHFLFAARMHRYFVPWAGGVFWVGEVEGIPAINRRVRQQACLPGLKGRRASIGGQPTCRVPIRISIAAGSLPTLSRRFAC